MAGVSVNDYDREELERELIRRLGKAGKAKISDLAAALGDPPDLANIPEAEWERLRQAVEAEISAVLTATMQTAMETALAGAPITIDWALANESAAAWVEAQTATIGKLISATDRQTIGNLVAQFYREGWDKTRLLQELEPLYGLVRAEMIATTEVTRAAVEGAREVVRMSLQPGMVAVEIWTTMADEKVCPICGGLDAQSVEMGQPFIHPKSGDAYDGPPAHIRCRCDIMHEFREAGG